MEAATLLTRALRAGAEPAADEVTERILDAATAGFLAFGPRRTTIEDVARRAGVARVTVYRRFGGREALVEAVVLREADRFIAELDAAVMPLPTVDERLAEGFVVTLRLARRHPLLTRLLAAEPEELLPHLTIHGGPALALARAYLAERIREAQAEGQVPQLDPEQVAEVVVRLAHSFVLTPESCIPLEDERAARAFAARYVAPIVTRAEPAAGA